MLRPKTPSMFVGTRFCSKLTLHQQIIAGESAAKRRTAGAYLGFEGGGDLLQALRAARSALPYVCMSSIWSRARYEAHALRAYGELTQIWISFNEWSKAYQSTDRLQHPSDCCASAGIHLSDMPTTLDAHMDVDRREGLLAEDEDCFIDLEAKDFGLEVPNGVGL